MQCGRLNSGIRRLLFQGVKSIPTCQMNSQFFSSSSNYETLAVSTPAPNVVHVQLNRPDKRNAMNAQLWDDIGKCFNSLNADTSCRAIVLSGNGSMFSSGIDLSGLGEMMEIIGSDEDIARKTKKFYNILKGYQDSFSSLEKCYKPIICAVHSACIGGAIDLICGTDIRYCTDDAWFQVKEVDIGLAADVGTLQRLPQIIGSQSLVRELAFSARKMFSDEALNQGLVSRVFPNQAGMIEAAVEMAATIARKSPVAVQGTKRHLIYARDHTVDESLEYQAIWNMTMLQSEDLVNSAKAMFSKTDPSFKDY